MSTDSIEEQQSLLPSTSRVRGSNRCVIVIGSFVILGVLSALTISLTLGQHTTKSGVKTQADDILTVESLLNRLNGSLVGRRFNVAERVKWLLQRVPLIDGHNDLAWSIRNKFRNHVDAVELDRDLSSLGFVTDIPRLKQGQLGGQFWSCYVSCDTQYKDAVRVTLDQCDVINRFIDKYPDVFERVDSAKGILQAFHNGHIASLIGVEGGHSIDSSLGTLRQLYKLGTRYMTLTHTCHTPWADSAGDLAGPPEEIPPVHGGLTQWGQLVVKEMNRLGMLVDVSHVSKATQLSALSVSVSPVIYSHSSAWTLCHNRRNVHDDVLYKLKANRGVVMVAFVPQFINCPPTNHSQATLQQVADHIEYIRDTIGVDHIGIGSDFEGTASYPRGLGDVSQFPALFEELGGRGWSDRDMAKVAGLNIIRVFEEVEQIRDKMAANGVPPYDEHIPSDDIPREAQQCRPDF